MKPHEDPCPICEEYKEKVRGLVYAYGMTKENRYYERVNQVLDTLAREHERQGIRVGRQTGNER